MNTSLLTRIVTALHARPRRALLALLAFVALAGAIGGPLASALESDGGFAPTESDSALAVERIEAATGQAPSPGIVLLVDGAVVGGPRSVEVADELKGLPGIAAVSPGGEAADASSSLVLGTLTADAVGEDVANAALTAFEDDPDVAVGGGTVAGTQLGEQIGADLGRAEMFAFPVLLLLALLFFGGRAALLPLVVGVTTVFGAFLALTGINQLYGLNVFVLNLVIGLGLGLAIDYTLFLLSRYREELAAQGATRGAVITTMATAGRTVAFSAATVAAALITLTVFPVGFLKSMGISGAVVAVVAAVASLVVAPAIFGLWGAKLARGRRRPAAALAGASGGAGSGSASGSGSEGRWYRLSHWVMRRPGAVFAATAIVMVALAAPAVRATWSPIDSSVIPTGLSARTVSDTIAADYEGTRTGPVTIAVESPDEAEVRAFAAEVSSVSGVQGPADVAALDSDTWQVNLAVDGDPAGESARQVVANVRDVVETTGIDALVAGEAAAFVDQQQALADGMPLAIGLLVGLTLLVLWLMTGSVVLPVLAVIMNVLTVGVALGALTFIYQDGRLTDLLGYTPNGGIEPTDFLVAACLVFALSTDYGVFLLGRIKESREAGLSEREAVATGLGRTGSVVTAAAILLAVAIGAFSTSEISFIQQIGLATAVGVLVDAFVVRTLLVPALMALMGKWNWWSPMPLRRLHDSIGLSEGATTPRPRPVAVAADTP